MSQIVTVSRFIGCDVGKSHIAVHDDASGASWQISNDAKSLAAFVRRLDPTCLVVCEATGGYEAALLAALLDKGVPAHRADARRVKDFIKSHGVRAKTDAIDARWLARYGQERHPGLPRWQAPDKLRRKLQNLVLNRQDFIDARVAFENRSKAPTCASKANAMLLKHIDKGIAQLDAEIAALVDDSPAIAGEVEVLRTIKGFGPKNAPALIALMPELGALDRKQAASLAGLAPHPRQSGAREAYRSTRGGRKSLKPALFMAALVAARHDTTLKAFYERLLANGKKPIAAITAVMRKLVVIANAKIRDHRAALNLKQVS